MALWGKVIRHRRGYRAQHARITGFFLLPEPLVDAQSRAFDGYNDLVRQLAGIYDVPVLKP